MQVNILEPIVDYLMTGRSVVCKDLSKDCCGITVQCGNQQAVDLYNQGLLEYIKGYGDCVSNFEKALELDPNFVLVHCALVCISYYMCSSIGIDSLILDNRYNVICRGA